MMLDLFVVALYALGMLGLGWWGMKRARNREDYLVAGRRLGPGMYLGTLSAVVLGGASTVGTVKLGYTYGLSGLWLCASLGLGLIVLSLILAKPLMKLKLYTVTQVLERRYTPAAKLISSIIMFAYDLMLAVTSTIGIGTVLSVIFGMPAWQAVVIGGIVVVIYSTIGGMWSLTLTDIVQFLIMTVGMVALLLPLTFHSVGGWDALLEKAPEASFSLTAIGWDTIITYFIIYFLGILIGQDIWQRVFTARTSGVARSAGTFAGIYCILYGMIGALVGIAASILLPNLDDANNAFAAIAQLALPDGIRGLIIAAAMAAMMSTSSAGMLASSTLLTQDILPALRGGREFDDVKINRLCTGLIGVVSVIIAINVSDVIGALTVAYNLLVGGMLIPMLGALFWKRSTTTGAIASMLAGCAGVIGFMIKDGLLANSPIYAGLALGMIAFVAGSLLTRPHSMVTSAP